jgi:GNAT superfamily N-acetyltransferase
LSVRRATVEDVVEMVSIGAAILRGEMSAHAIVTDPNKMADYVAKFIGPDHAAAFVFEQNGAIVGFILAFVCESELGHEIVGKKCTWLMKHKGHGAALMRAAEAWAASQGAVKWFATLPDPMPRPVMARLGYKPIETVYEKVLRPVAHEAVA